MSSTNTRGGRRRSPIWEHFLLGKNADGNRVAQCTFCTRVMKSQPDRMENHFLKLCAQVDMDTRRRWLQDRENRVAISTAAAALQRQRVSETDNGDDKSSTITSSSVNIIGSGGSLQAAVEEAAAAGDAHVKQLKVSNADHVIDDPELSTASPAPVKPRNKLSSGKGGSATKKQQHQVFHPIQPQQQQQQFQPAQAQSQTQPEQQRNFGNPHFSILKEVNGKPERVELENLRLMRAESELDSQTIELKKRKLEIEERKSNLQIENMRYDNDIKRIKVAEENMLARKRLRDAGVPQEEIDLLLPLQKPDAGVYKSI